MRTLGVLDESLLPAAEPDEESGAIFDREKGSPVWIRVESPFMGAIGVGGVGLPRPVARARA